MHSMPTRTLSQPARRRVGLDAVGVQILEAGRIRELQQVVDRADVLLVADLHLGAAHQRAGSAPAQDQTGLLEMPQRFAQRVAARLEALAQVSLRPAGGGRRHGRRREFPRAGFRRFSNNAAGAKSACPDGGPVLRHGPRRQRADVQS
jgi:hypothetical protein